jgi:signal transduction histidine kinase
VKFSLFRVIQESFQKIIKHASATEVLIDLITMWSTLKLFVRDKEDGFDKE